ncbi:hypothetical protein UPYG_G00060690 [Umbra pygmaea]|uniref:Immunoglobulin V-set domain-containing protein n=1 Tax=Umbra pygmaea TaxID=75934 RepID=A0ABD0XP99_UMBPY
MKILHVVSCCLLSALCIEASATNKVEVVGGYVRFACSYKWAKDNNKYFCKYPCSDKDILVQTKGSKNVTQGRYSIHDEVENGLFYVTIKDVMKTDSGTYWCGVGRSLIDTYTKLYLTVTDAPKSTINPRPDVSTIIPNLFATSFNNTTTKSNLSATSNNPTTKSNLSATSQNVFTSFTTSGGNHISSSSRADTTTQLTNTQLVWTSVGLVVMVTVLGLVLVLFYKQRRRHSRPTPPPVYCNTNTAPSGETDCLYEEIKEASAPTDNLPLTMTSVKSTVKSPNCQASTLYSSVTLPQDSSSLSVDSGTQVFPIYSTASSPEIL